MPAGRMYVAARAAPRRRRKPKQNFKAAVRKIIQQQEEIKLHDVNFFGTACTQLTAGASNGTYLNAISQGDGDGDRDGDMIRIKSIQLKGYFQESGGNSANVRCIIARDMQNAGANVTTGDILTGVVNFAEPISKTEQNQKRFVILMDKYFPVNSSAEGEIRIVDYYKEFKKNLNTKYTGATNAIGDAGSGALFMWLLTDVVANHPVLNANVRIRYYQ